MTTEPEAKAIEPDYQLLKSNLADAAVRLSKTRSNADLSLFLDAMNEVVAALPSVDAHREVKSRLQAAEAELGRVSAIVEAWGDIARLVVKTLQYTPTGYVRYEKPNGELGNDHIRSVEPAPQPPATTGEPLLGPVDALRAEIVAALRKVTRTLITLDPATLARAVADELERRQP